MLYVYALLCGCQNAFHSFITAEPYKVGKVPNSLKKSNTQGFVPRG